LFFGEKVKPTPVVVRNFVNTLRKIFPKDFDFQILGFNINDRESVKRYLLEECEDLEYHECLRKIVKAYESIIQKEYDYLGEAQRQMNYYLGTPYVSEAFKKIYQKYKDRIIDLLLSEDHQELSLIEDYLTAKYGCVDYDVRRFTDLTQLRFKTQFIEAGGLELFAEQLATYMNLRPATTRYELFDYAFMLGVATTQNDFMLVCITQYIDESIKGTVITSSDKPFILINFNKRSFAIIQ
jgi:hypothetical protein